MEVIHHEAEQRGSEVAVVITENREIAADGGRCFVWKEPLEECSSRGIPQMLRRVLKSWEATPLVLCRGHLLPPVPTPAFQVIMSALFVHSLFVGRLCTDQA